MKNFDFLDAYRDSSRLVDPDDSWYSWALESRLVVYCIRVSRILMLQGRGKEGESVSLGLDFRSSVTASPKIGPLPFRCCLVRLVLLLFPMDHFDHDRPNQSPLIFNTSAATWIFTLNFRKKYYIAFAHFSDNVIQIVYILLKICWFMKFILNSNQSIEQCG